MSLSIHKGIVTKADRKQVQVSLPEEEVSIPNSRILQAGGENRIYSSPRPGDKVIVLLDDESLEGFILGFLEENSLEFKLLLGDNETRIEIKENEMTISGFSCQIKITLTGTIILSAPVKIELNAPLVTAMGYQIFPPTYP